MFGDSILPYIFLSFHSHSWVHFRLNVSNYEQAHGPISQPTQQLLSPTP